jgi:predicted phage-related endonuclease
MEPAMGIAKGTEAVKRNRPASIKLAKTHGLSRDEWLTVRKKGIGGSDAAAAIGLNPYQSPLELWMIKTGRDEGLPKIDPNDATRAVFKTGEVSWKRSKDSVGVDMAKLLLDQPDLLTRYPLVKPGSR